MMYWPVAAKEISFKAIFIFSSTGHVVKLINFGRSRLSSVHQQKSREKIGIKIRKK